MDRADEASSEKLNQERSPRPTGCVARATRKVLTKILTRVRFCPPESAAQYFRNCSERDLEGHGERSASARLPHAEEQPTDGPTPRVGPEEIGRPEARAAEQAALRDALELVGGIHAAAARLRQASYRTPMQKRREEERARHSGFGALA